MDTTVTRTDDDELDLVQARNKARPTQEAWSEGDASDKSDNRKQMHRI